MPAVRVGVLAVALLTLLAFGSGCGAGSSSLSAGSQPSPTAHALPSGVTITRQKAIESGAKAAGATNLTRSAAKLVTFGDLKPAGMTPPEGNVVTESSLVWAVALQATFTVFNESAQGNCYAIVDAARGDAYQSGCDSTSTWPTWFDALKDLAA